MIIKSHELNKINLDQNPFILLYGKNEGFKNQAIVQILKNKDNISKYEEKEVLENSDSFLENIYSKSLFDSEKSIVINRITDKIRVENNSLPSGNTLSSINRLSQVTEASSSYTDSVNYLEVAFSPQNQINDDIIAQMGHFNIGDYIGDPRQRFLGSRYEDLNNLSEEYFKKYIK